jgi:RHS repeat-associated protein
MFHIRHPFFALVFASLFVFPASAQVQTGIPTFGSFGGGPDVINLANLNSHITVPIIQKPGRGMPFAYDLIYDSSVWFPVGSSGSQSWSFSGSWGWQVLGQYTGVTAHDTTGAVCTINGRNYHGITIYSNWRYYDRFGIRHSFPNAQTYFYTSPCGSGSTSDQQTASDGSGYELFATGGSGYVVSSTGTTLGSTLATDRNGNEISVNSNGVFTDTLGTTVLTMAGTAPSPVTFTYTAPSGANAVYTVQYTSYPIQTNFGCSGITEYGTNGTTTANLISEIDLPDISVNPNDKYTLTYEATPSHAGFVTGRLASVTLPTGGRITYSYTGGGTGVNGISCSDGSAATLARTTPDGTWSYARTFISGAQWQTKVTDPLGNDTVIQFQGIYETQRLAYQGSSSTGTLLRTINTCYNGTSSPASTTPCTTTAVSLPITQRSITLNLPGAKNLISQHIDYYPLGVTSETDDYDYGAGAVGSLLRKITYSYAPLGNITAFRKQMTITDGSGAVISRTNYNYDETSVVPTSGTPQHTSVSGSRGNLTSINYYTSGTTTLTKSMAYFDTGNVQTITDVNGAQTTYTFGACGNSFPTSVSKSLNLTMSTNWNCNGGALTSLTDENTQVTSITYSDTLFWRPASAVDAANATTNTNYLGISQKESTLSFNGGNSAVDQVATLDGLGRPILRQLREAPGSSNFDSVETDYDALGRIRRTTLPYVGGMGATNTSAPGVTRTYDAVGRVLSITDSGNTSTTISYSQNDEFVTVGPAPSGEYTKRRQFERDALGRLTSVCEVTSGTTAWPGGSCAQNTAQTGYWTKYAYDAAGHITGVTQNAQESGSTQSRSYNYDLMGRLISETTPEAGTTNYTSDTDSTCGTYSGDLVKRVDAVGNVTCFSYDQLHRRLSSTYPSGPYASQTANKYFVYDSATVNNQVMGNGKGRLIEAYTATCQTCNKITDLGFSYTARGGKADIYESTPNSGAYYHVNAQYWENGSLKQLSGLPTLPTLTWSPDGEARLSTVSASSGQNPVTSTVFNAASLPTTVTYGSGDSDVYTYDSNTNRQTQYQFNVNGQSLTGTLTWNANHTLQSLSVTDAFNSADTQNCSYSYDDMSRLISANCGNPAAQTFSYDSFGNISKSGSPYSFQPTYSTSTNRITAVGSFIPTYDANGNTLTDPANTYSWDSAGKPISVNGVNLTYDALGRMVEQNRSGAYTQIVYGPSGAKLALMSGSTLLKAFVPLPGGAQAVFNGSGLLYYGHSDHLGSIRLASSPSRTITFDLAYAPFGETYATSGSIDPTFTGQRQDTSSGLYDFATREYSTEGRWSSPDPSGLSSANLQNPQTLNLFAYVSNNPLMMIDPQGLDEEDDGDSFSGVGGGGGGTGAGGGGVDGGQSPFGGGSSGGAGAGGSWGDGPADGSTSGGNDGPVVTLPGSSVTVNGGTVGDIPTQDSPISDSLTPPSNSSAALAAGAGAGAGAGLGFSSSSDVSASSSSIDSLVVGGGNAAGFPEVPGNAISLNIDPSAQPDVLGDVANMPFAPNSFNSATYEYVPYSAFTGENISAIEETADVLAPGGVLTIMTGSGAPLTEITGALGEAGFSSIEVLSVNPLIITAIWGVLIP